jgi:hypothetical protein
MKEKGKPKIKLLGKSEDGSLEFFHIGYNVYRVKSNWVPDADGYPSDRRWECSIEQWERYRKSVFSFVVGVDTKQTETESEVLNGQ